MKLLSTQLSYFLSERETRRNIRALLKFLGLLLGTIAVFSVLFHVIMLYEGHDHSWLTGLYWTLTVMSTLGFGDITFSSDLGRLFSIIVLLSGTVLLLIVLPFTFIRFFYAPWLEAQIRSQAPRKAPDNTQGHVIICTYNTIAAGLIERLRLYGIPYYVIEPDPTAAARMHGDRISVVTGEVDSRAMYEKLQVSQARLVLANCQDTPNTNITLTVREATPAVPIVALVDNEDSVDILELSGCTHVLPLKQRLGERLAMRIHSGHAQAHVIGRFRDLLVAEFPVHNSLNVIGIQQNGRLVTNPPATTTLVQGSELLLLGSTQQRQTFAEVFG